MFAGPFSVEAPPHLCVYAGRRFNSGNITNKLITFKALKCPYLILGWRVGLGDPTPFSNFRGGRGLSFKFDAQGCLKIYA